MKKKELTPLQEKFLEVLHGEAKGDPHKAKIIAGYDPTTSTASIVKALQEEILDQTRMYLATYSPKAMMELLLLLDEPNSPGATTKLKIIQDILNRAGVVERKEATDINLKVPKGGIVIMPAKDVNKKDDSNEDEEE